MSDRQSVVAIKNETPQRDLLLANQFHTIGDRNPGIGDLSIHTNVFARSSGDHHRQLEPTFLSRMAVRIDDKVRLIHLRDVLWIQSNGNYIRLHLNEADYDYRVTMKDLSSRLDPRSFLQIHRNAIVNLDYVADFHLPRAGNASVQLKDGKALPVSRTGRMALRRKVLSSTFSDRGWPDSGGGIFE